MKRACEGPLRFARDREHTGGRAAMPGQLAGAFGALGGAAAGGPAGSSGAR